MFVATYQSVNLSHLHDELLRSRNNSKWFLLQLTEQATAMDIKLTLLIVGPPDAPLSLNWFQVLQVLS